MIILKRWAGRRPANAASAMLHDTAAAKYRAGKHDAAAVEDFTAAPYDAAVEDVAGVSGN